MLPVVDLIRDSFFSNGKLHPPQKKRFLEQTHNWKHLYLCIFLVPHSVLPQLQPHRRSTNAPPGDGLLGALTTGCSVAKRQ